MRLYKRALLCRQKGSHGNQKTKDAESIESLQCHGDLLEIAFVSPSSYILRLLLIKLLFLLLLKLLK